MDPVTFPRYPEIALLVRRPEIFSVKEVIATEKLHGSAFRLFFPAGMTSIEDIRYGSRDVISGEGTEKFPLGNAMRYFTEKPELLTNLWETIKSYGYSDATLFGEAYGPGIKAKGIRYSNEQGVLFRAYDIMVGRNFLTWDLFCEVTAKMAIPRVHEVWRGEPTLANFDALLEQASVEAKLNGIEGETAEGVVIRSNPLLRNVFGEWLIVKCKSAKFSEVAHAALTPKIREAGPADGFAMMFVTEGRVTNAIGRLQDRGVTLKNTMADMPTMISEVVADLHKECESDWPEKITDKQMGSAVSKVLAPIYRTILDASVEP